jgi:16S rRNA (guanine527-N7)-methyltransferase
MFTIEDRSRLASLLAKGASMLDCPLTDFQVSKFLLYLVELRGWNRRVNLTAITEDEAIIERHFLDSLAGLKAIEKRADPTLLDIGTGAGFPGLPLKIALPDLRVTLVESSQKKATFLHHVIGRLHISGVTVLNRNVEDLEENGTRYDWVVARAFAKKEIVLKKALCLLSPTGRFILFQGQRESERPPDIETGWVKTIFYELPFSKIRRRLEIFRCNS